MTPHSSLFPITGITTTLAITTHYEKNESCRYYRVPLYCSFYHPSFSLTLHLSLPLSIYQSLFPSIPFFHYISLPISKMPLTTSTCGCAVLWETICLPSRPELVQEVRHCRKVLDFMPFPVPVTLPTDTWVITVYRPGILLVFLTKSFFISNQPGGGTPSLIDVAKVIRVSYHFNFACCYI